MCQRQKGQKWKWSWLNSQISFRSPFISLSLLNIGNFLPLTFSIIPLRQLVHWPCASLNCNSTRGHPTLSPPRTYNLIFFHSWDLKTQVRFWITNYDVLVAQKVGQVIQSQKGWQFKFAPFQAVIVSRIASNNVTKGWLLVSGAWLVGQAEEDEEPKKITLTSPHFVSSRLY